MSESSPTEPRLGRIELAIIDKLSHDAGVTSRGGILASAYPDVAAGQRTLETAAAFQARRARAEAAISRALAGLERKGWVVRERNPVTGRTMIRAVGAGALPTWEQLARAEEDLAAHCARVARQWQELSRRARHRAATLRTERSEGGTDAERVTDLGEVARLEGGER